MSRRRAVLVVLVATVLAGCGAAGGSKDDAETRQPGSGANPGGSAATSAPSSTPPPAAGAAASGSPTPGAAAAPSPSAPSGAATPPPGSQQAAAPVATREPAGLPFRATLTPRCLERGGTLTVEVATRAHASIAAAAVFSDDDAHGAFAVGAADPRGRWAWRAPVPADAPLGDGEVQLSAQDRSPGPTEHEAGTTGEEAEAIIPFEVRRSC